MMFLGKGRRFRRWITITSLSAGMVMITMAFVLQFIPVQSQNVIDEEAYQAARSQCIENSALFGAALQQSEGRRLHFEFFGALEESMIKVDAIQASCHGFRLERACLGDCEERRQYIGLVFHAGR